MRIRLPVVGVFLSLFLAGCASDAPTEEPETGEPVEAPTALPPDIQGSASVTASVYDAIAPCTDPHACHEYEFQVGNSSDAQTTTVWMDATLTWGMAASDFDLILYKGNEELDADYGRPPATAASLSRVLDEGWYTIMVDAYAVPLDDFAIEVLFTPAEMDADAD